MAEAARRQGRLDRVELVVSEVGLGKDGPTVADVAERREVLLAVTATRPWLSVRTTTAQLVTEIAAGYDAVILGADKWAQLMDPRWYPSLDARDAALERLPDVLVAPRPPFPLPSGLTILDLDAAYAEVSSTAVRAGRWEWILPEAARGRRR